MKIIKDSAEHHFLTTLEKMKQDPGGWIGIHLALSRRLNHSTLVGQREHIKGKLFKLNKLAEGLAHQMAETTAAFTGTKIYHFTDNDVVLLTRPKDEAQIKELKALFKNVSEQADKKLCRYSNLASDIYQYQKMADQRLLGAKRIKAYEALADTNQVHSIPLRRQRRTKEEKVVLIVEDDRFTASYAANILNKDYDLVLAKTGEEAITAYIEHAPDIVLLDIHLPGLNGHETLQAIREAEPQSYVVMLSVDTAKDNVLRASKTGASAFLKKPFTKDRLCHVVAQSPFLKDKLAMS